MNADYESFYYQTPDQLRLYVRHWQGSAPTRGTILIAHGLGETADYYEEFSVKAAEKGFDVFVPEMRGHGRTAGDIRSSDYKKQGGNPGPDCLHKMAGDIRGLAESIKNRDPQKPLFLLGHSMGSVAAQLCTGAGGGLLTGLILTGVLGFDHMDRLMESIEKEIRQRGLKEDCRDTFHLMFDGALKPFLPVKTPLDWITSDEEMICQSLTLPYTAVLFNNEFYLEFFRALLETQDPRAFRNLQKELPIVILGGGSDVMGQNGRAAEEKQKMFSGLGFADVRLKIYPDFRHSILREKGRAEVESDIFSWVDSLT